LRATINAAIIALPRHRILILIVGRISSSLPRYTTRSRVSAFMNKFRKLGLISYNGKIEVHNSLLNAVLHEKPEIERDDPSSKV
jgi:hypothetical protein